MRLLIGGMSQGKLACAKQITGATEEQIISGAICSLTEAQSGLVLNELHMLVRRCMEANIDEAVLLNNLLIRNPSLIITAQEIGSGIVPLDHREREWRERTGRLCCMLAAKAEQVDRVVCGLLTQIK